MQNPLYVVGVSPGKTITVLPTSALFPLDLTKTISPSANRYSSDGASFKDIIGNSFESFRTSLSLKSATPRQ